MGKLAKVENYQKASESMMQDKCVCLSVRFGFLGTSRTVDKEKLGVDANKERLHAVKSIMESENINQISKLHSRAYGYLWSKILPAPLRKGMYLLPTEFIAELDEKLEAYDNDTKPYIEALIEELPELKKADRKELRDLYREEDYPTPDQIRNAFYIEAMYVDFRVPDKLKQISDKMFSNEVKKQAKAWEESAVEINEFLRWCMKELVDRLTNQLKIEKAKKGDKEGKRGKLYDTGLDKLRQFAEDFPFRNLADDKKLLAIVGKAKKIVGDVDADTLREDDALRQSMFDGMAEIQKEVDLLILKAPGRIISLE